jgi:hypothetical protein
VHRESSVVSVAFQGVITTLHGFVNLLIHAPLPVLSQQPFFLSMPATAVKKKASRLTVPQVTSGVGLTLYVLLMAVLPRRAFDPDWALEV